MAGNENGWAAWEKKVLGDIKRLEANQGKIFDRLEKNSIAVATLWVRVTMLSGGIALAISIGSKALI